MGLAASQARFLAITSRKMNCEFQSMQIAQQKLSVTRDLQKAAQDYQTNLSATKLVWEDMDSNTYDVTYGIMMSPSAINQYDPYLITDTKGKIVLNDTMYNAAVKAGIINKNTGEPTGNFSMGNADGTSKTDGSRNAFLYQLGRAGVIGAGTIDSIYDLGDDGYTQSGIGGPVADKATANALPSNAFKGYLSSTTYEDVGKTLLTLGLPEGADVKDKIYGINFLKLFEEEGNDGGLDGSYSTEQRPGSKKFGILKDDGTYLTEDKAKSLTLGDFLNGNYTLIANGSDNDKDKNIYKTIIDKIATMLGHGDTSGNPVGLNVDKESDYALTKAYELTNQQFENKLDLDAFEYLDEYVSSFSSNKIVTCDGLTFVNLSNLLKTFLTYFAITMDGQDSEFKVGDKKKGSKYATDDPNYYFLLSNDAGQTNQTMLQADFYNMIYNQICLHGACTDATKRNLVEDREYLNHALKNGQLFISSLNNDGYFYGGHYTLNGHVGEVPDEDAIARAEVEYNITKSKLNYKEETLELQMKNLDMEIASLTTEYDTVKNLISKGVEKVFTMFSS